MRRVVGAVGGPSQEMAAASKGARAKAYLRRFGLSGSGDCVAEQVTEKDEQVLTADDADGRSFTGECKELDYLLAL